MWYNIVYYNRNNFTERVFTMVYKTDKEYGFVERSQANALKEAADLISASLQVNNMFAIENGDEDYVKVNLIIPKERFEEALRILNDFDKQCIKNKKMSFK